MSSHIVNGVKSLFKKLTMRPESKIARAKKPAPKWQGQRNFGNPGSGLRLR